MTKTALALLLTSLLTANAHAEKIALLIGVGDYADPSMPDLDGPAHDLKAMRELLVKRWSFKPDNIRVLQDNQATQAAIVEVLVRKSLAALKATGLTRLVVSGGVGANAELRRQLDEACARRGWRVHYPELELCTDNGAMIALAAAMRLQAGVAEPSMDHAFDVRPRWPLAELATGGTPPGHAG